MAKVYIVPYKSPLDSITELKKALGKTLVRVHPESESFTVNRVLKDNSVLINWGNANHPAWEDRGYFLNKVSAVRLASNKIKTFFTLDMAEVSTVEFTEDVNIANSWLKSGDVVLGRKLVSASGGRGIIQFEGVNTTVTDPCPLYTKYKKKKNEYRVHVFAGKVIDVQWKRRASEGVTDTRIRNHDNGWVFCRENLVEPKDLRPLAISAIMALKLDFGAVDIIWNEREDRSYVLEVNTAPGITGTTLTNYVIAIKSLIGEK